jgi:hypothetical protein
MKMTKIESARIIIKQKGICFNRHRGLKTISCDDCFNGWRRNKCANLTDEETLALAEAYIKRHESKSKKKVEEPKPIKTVGIDNSDVTLALTAQHEPVKDCPVNSEIPQPIKLPDFVYSASKNGVGFIDTKNRTFNTNDKGELLINDKPCFATPEEALQVAKKLWNGDGK